MQQARRLLSSAAFESKLLGPATASSRGDRPGCSSHRSAGGFGDRYFCAGLLLIAAPPEIRTSQARRSARIEPDARDRPLSSIVNFATNRVTYRGLRISEPGVFVSSWEMWAARVSRGRL
jgi:hypothetical protein